jgi:hypothetical protein
MSFAQCSGGLMGVLAPGLRQGYNQKRTGSYLCGCSLTMVIIIAGTQQVLLG